MPIARKHSRKRDAILECLRCTTSHPTAEWVYTQLKPTIPDLSLATVYRNLAMFKDEGTLVSVGVSRVLRSQISLVNGIPFSIWRYQNT